MVVTSQVQRISDCICCFGWIDFGVLRCLCKFTPVKRSFLFFIFVNILGDPEGFLNFEISGMEKKKA